MIIMTDYWKYVKPDPRWLENNPYINPPKPGDKPKPPVAGNPPPDAGTQLKVINLADFIQLDNISCRGSNGNVFEHYDHLFVKKDIERDSANSDNKTNQINFTPYNAIVHFEDQGLFLPSFALSCNILAALYASKNDADVAKVLNQYKNKGNGTGYHAQNTLVDWEAKRVIHYPVKADYTAAGGSVDVNSQRTRQRLSFNNAGFSNMDLDDALKNSNYRSFIQNLTGLQNPEILVDIGVYFGKTARSWISSSDETRAAWLGCSNLSFSLGTDINLVNSYAARGVSIAAAGGVTPKK
jgi:hypothetical protein